MRWLLFLTGCSGTISGSIDGEPVPSARTAIFDEAEWDFGIFGSLTVVQVFITDIPDACAFFDALEDASLDSCEATCADYGVLAEQYLGADQYYALSLTLRDDSSIEGDYVYGDLDADGRFVSSYTDFDVTRVYDVAVCIDECEEGDPVYGSDTDDAIDGTLTIEEWEAGLALQGEYDVNYGGDDGLRGHFDAEPCNMDDWVWFL